MNENMEFPGATEADINWLQDCFVQCLKDKVLLLIIIICQYNYILGKLWPALQIALERDLGQILYQN